MISLAIVGGGQGGLTILKLVEDMENVELKWVADIDENAPAVQKARGMGVETVKDFIPKIGDTSLQVLIEVTGNEKVRELLYENKHDRLSIIDARGALFLVDIVKRREEMLQKINEQAQTLVHNAEILHNNTAQIRQGLEQLAREAEGLAQKGQELSATADEANRAVSDINDILKIIQDIANKTNIIGLNASIEAARVGQAGRGFAVVAEEIRKLAESSKSSIQQIARLAENIVQFIEKMEQGIKSSGKTAQNQAANTKEFLVSLEEVSSISASLEEMAGNLVNIK